MAEAFYNGTEGSGKKLHMNSRTIGADLQHDEYVLLGEAFYQTEIDAVFNVSVATANDHLLCLNAPASLNLRVVRIRVEQATNATAGATDSFEVRRTTTGAPTGGTAITPAQYDTADAASGAAGRSLPTVKGTESTVLFTRTLTMRQTVATAGAQVNNYWEWVKSPWGKGILVPAGTTNGLVVKNIVATAGGTVNVEIEFYATNFV